MVGILIVLSAAFLLCVFMAVSKVAENRRWRQLPVITEQQEPELRYVRIINPTPEQLAANEERRYQVQQWREQVLSDLKEDEWPHPEAHAEAS